MNIIGFFSGISGIEAGFPCQAFSVAGYQKGFEDSFIIPQNMRNAFLYKMAGNSVVLPLITRIAKNIYEALMNHLTVKQIYAT